MPGISDYVLGLDEVIALLGRFGGSEKMKSDDENTLAALIRKRLGDHILCTVFENKLFDVWPRAYEHDSRIKEIEAFAKANGWSVSSSDPGLRLAFKKLKV